MVFPLSDRSDLKLKGITTNSQVSFAFYSTKTHKDNEGGSTSPSASDFNVPLPPPYQCNVIHAVSKDCFSQIDWPALQKDFSSKKNKDLGHAYRAKFSERERDLIKVQWAKKMIESQKHILFFDFLQKHFPFDNSLKKDKTIVKFSHSSFENIRIEDKISPTSLDSKTNSQKNIERIEKMLSDLKINSQVFSILPRLFSQFPNNFLI